MAMLRDKKLFLFDLDGTLYLDEELFDGTVDILEYIKSVGGRYMFLTNNSSKSVDAYIAKMKRLGIETTKEDFLTSVDALVDYLSGKSYKKMYVSGTRSFFDQLKGAGFPVVNELEDGIDCLVCGYDTELTYKKLEDSCILLGRGVDFIAANPDWVCPTWYGFAPDCGSVCQMLTIATGKKPRFIGNPNPEMIYLSLKRAGYKPEESVLVGDRIYTDIASALNAGVEGYLVLSGETTLEDAEKSEIKPTRIYKNVKEIYELYKEGKE